MDEPNIKNYMEYDLVAATHGEDTARSLAAAVTIAVHGCIGSISSVSHSLGKFHMVVARAVFGHLSHESDIIERALTIMEMEDVEINADGTVTTESWQKALAKARAEYREFLNEQVEEILSEDEAAEMGDFPLPPTKH